MSGEEERLGPEKPSDSLWSPEVTEALLAEQARRLAAADARGSPLFQIVRKAGIKHLLERNRDPSSEAWISATPEDTRSAWRKVQGMAVSIFLFGVVVGALLLAVFLGLFAR